MSDFNRTIARELAKLGGGKIVRGNSFGNVNPLTEWIKWLSYEPAFEKERIEILNSKIGDDLSIDELNELCKYKIRNRMANLFIKYNKGECDENEYMEVYDYMENSINELMLEKLSSEELKIAKTEINRLSKISKEELNAKVKEEQKIENYEKLSMVDSYILHIISDIDYSRSMNELNRKIDIQLKENDVMLRKSLYYANQNK